jgi:hypothetical protein
MPRSARTARCADQHDAAPRHDALVALLLGEPGWREAVAAQDGCFHPASAAARTCQPK